MSKLTDLLLDVLMPVLPRSDLSHWVGRLVNQKLPGPLGRYVGRQAVELFAKAYAINLEEAELPVSEYETIGALFTRKLKPGARPIGSSVVHTADALITEAGEIRSSQLIQAKGKTYSVVDLLRSQHFAKTFDGGEFATYYLCPTDYHRVHSPVDGGIIWSSHVPGELWPVNAWSVKTIANLFAVNERIAMVVETAHGLAAVVMVAATNVGNMSVNFDEAISSRIHHGRRAVKEHSYVPAKQVSRGSELGIFHMGSTVIVLFEKKLALAAGLGSLQRFRGQNVKMGRSLLSGSTQSEN